MAFKNTLNRPSGGGHAVIYIETIITLRFPLGITFIPRVELLKLLFTTATPLRAESNSCCPVVIRHFSCKCGHMHNH
jgi:hypothetical protein